MCLEMKGDIPETFQYRGGLLAPRPWADSISLRRVQKKKKRRVGFKCEGTDLWKVENSWL